MFKLLKRNQSIEVQLLNIIMILFLISQLEELNARFEEVQAQKDNLTAECAHYKVTLQETVSTDPNFIILLGFPYCNFFKEEKGIPS